MSKQKSTRKFNPDCPTCRAEKRGKKSVEKAKPKTLAEWIVSRSLSKSDLSKGGVGLLYHVQARTADQFSSFATLCSENAPMTRGKAVDGETDIFTCMSDQGHATMNVLGKIRYEGTWPK